MSNWNLIISIKNELGKKFENKKPVTKGRRTTRLFPIWEGFFGDTIDAGPVFIFVCLPTRLSSVCLGIHLPTCLFLCNADWLVGWLFFGLFMCLDLGVTEVPFQFSKFQ